MNDADLAAFTEDNRKLFYNKWLEKDEESNLNFIRRPALTGFLTGSLLAQAELQAKLYSTPPTA